MAEVNTDLEPGLAEWYNVPLRTLL